MISGSRTARTPIATSSTLLGSVPARASSRNHPDPSVQLSQNRVPYSGFSGPAESFQFPAGFRQFSLLVLDSRG
ncbi:hypothetical protein CRG98_002218 [Punica granatum]|uniref:Uncharacterized protein n=1 Tax=Punica granatum TaxID=22663 RepID=A0A2I0L9L9_PUNGR|nr:hypothetical protein CRG98_002218 [Punica granatum]